ncbi:hypothetical protein [Hydrogenophaga luteola]|uniref:Uncharacterized protein n=1 Tax=Hydrogenophaga luteola TaxID=1591122 RepID=A0ABV7W2R2_9BURK
MASVVRGERVEQTPLAGRDEAKTATALHERVAGLGYVSLSSGL